MSDQAGSNQQPPAGQPGSASPAAGQGEQAAGQPNPYLTVDDARKLFQDEFRKTSQSITDRVTNQVQKIMDAAREQGVTMTQQQAEAVLKATEAATPKQPPGQETPAATPPAQEKPQTGQPPAQEKGQQPPLDPVSAKGVKILKDEFGLEIDPDNIDDTEPEFALLKLDAEDPEEYFASVRAYGAAKAKSQKEAGDPAAIPALGSGGQAAPQTYEGMSGRQILNQAYKGR